MKEELIEEYNNIFRNYIDLLKRYKGSALAHQILEEGRLELLENQAKYGADTLLNFDQLKARIEFVSQKLTNLKRQNGIADISVIEEDHKINIFENSERAEQDDIAYYNKIFSSMVSKFSNFYNKPIDKIESDFIQYMAKEKEIYGDEALGISDKQRQERISFIELNLSKILLREYKRDLILAMFANGNAFKLRRDESLEIIHSHFVEDSSIYGGSDISKIRHCPITIDRI